MKNSVALDISALNPAFKEHAKRGIGRYVREIYQFLKNDNEIFSLSTFDQCTLLNNYEKKIISSLPCGKQSISQQIFIPYKLRRHTRSADFIHFPAHTDVPLLAPRPYIVTVLDLIYLLFKDLYDQGNYRARFARALEIASIKNADMIIAISECTANDVFKLLKIPYEKIRVTHLGVDESFFNLVLDRDYENNFRKEYNLLDSTKIILYVGGIDQRKNYKTLLETVKILQDKYKENKAFDFRLVMVGSIQNDRQYPIYKNLIKEYKIDDIVIEAGFLEDSNLKSLYKFSTLLFFPTLYEGFGLTPLEALASGLPVVASNTPAVKEVVRDFALTADAKDSKTFASYIDNLFLNIDLRKRLSVEGIEHAKNFTWEKTGEKTIEVYEEMFKKI
ncbi:MAG: glycosyltransferase family 4 protein [Bdellovibrionota bacterium]